MDHKIGRYIVNGSHESSKLQDMLDGFIKKFVLCAECENPETELVSIRLQGYWEISPYVHIVSKECELWFLECPSEQRSDHAELPGMWVP